MFGGEPDGAPRERPGEEFARGHYEQLVGATGTIRVGDDDVDDRRLRPARPLVGPAHWQAPWYYRWLTANFGDDFGFMGSRIARRDGDGTAAASCGTATTLHLCDDMRRSAPSGTATTSTTSEVARHG